MMKAARLGADGTITVTDVPIPEPQVGQARLKVLQAGICNTDIELSRGCGSHHCGMLGNASPINRSSKVSADWTWVEDRYKGFEGTLGHEFVALVEKICPSSTSSSHVKEGDRVVSEINFVKDGSGCRCYHERAQYPERAAMGIIGADGAFAEYVISPIINLHLVPESLSDDQAMFAEPLAAACQILQQYHFRHDDTAAVVGTGKLGIMIAQAIASTHTPVIVLGRRADAFPRFQEHGLKTALVSDMLAQGQKFSVVVDCTGSANGFDSALNMTKPSGTLVMKSTFAGNTDANLTKVVVDEITLIGSRCGPFRIALSLLETRRVVVDGLISHRFGLEQAAEAVAKAAAPDSFKVAIRLAPVSDSA